MEHTKTIEGVLHKAIVDVGGISQQNATKLQKVNWGRASRTDKGVHAVVNIISLKMLVDEKNMERMVNDLNQLLMKNNIVIHGMNV